MFGFRKKEKKQSAKQLSTEAVSSITMQASWRAEAVARTLNPNKLAKLLQSATQDYNSEYLTLAEEMEEKDPHYAGTLAVRKRAVSRLGVTIEAADDSATAGAHVEFLQSVVEKPEFETMVYDLMDAIGKGYSAVEIMWEMGAKAWLPVGYKWRDPRWFVFDKETMRILRLYDAQLVGGRELPPYKFIVHFPHLKSGVPIRGGLARLVAVSYMCKQFVLSDWLSFMDLYGMPIRIGKYGSEATKEDIGTLKTAVASLGIDGAAVIPQSMDISFEQMANNKSSAGVFREAAQWLDEQVSKAVLGQTMTTDNGSSKSQAEVHNDVRLDILEADANALQNTINEQLVKPIIDLNFGIQEHYPRVIIRVPRKENVELLVDSVVKLVPLGVQIPERFIREKLGIPEATAGETLLGMPAPASAETARNALQLNGETEDEEDIYGEWASIPADITLWVGRVVDEASSLADVQKHLNSMPELNSEAVQSFALALLKERVKKT